MLRFLRHISIITRKFSSISSQTRDDIVNLRLNEIPQIDEDDIEVAVFGGVE